MTDEGRKRVLATVAGILVARHLKTPENLGESRPGPRSGVPDRVRCAIGRSTHDADRGLSVRLGSQSQCFSVRGTPNDRPNLRSQFAMASVHSRMNLRFGFPRVLVPGALLLLLVTQRRHPFRDFAEAHDELVSHDVIKELLGSLIAVAVGQLQSSDFNRGLSDHGRERDRHPFLDNWDAFLNTETLVLARKGAGDNQDMRSFILTLIVLCLCDPAVAPLQGILTFVDDSTCDFCSVHDQVDNVSPADATTDSVDL